MPGPLEGVKVLDVSQLAVGPWAGALLGQLGAEVFKIEDPRGDPIRNLLPWMNGVGTYYTAVNLNKKDIALDLKNPRDLEIALKLAERVDVFLENFRPGVMDRLGLGYDAIKKINPGIVYCSSSGYGSRGPRRSEGSADGYARSFTGFDSINGPEGGPAENFRNRGHIDHTSSSFIAQVILAALYVKERTGRGQKVETSMMQATMTYQTSRITEYFATGKTVKPMGSATTNLVPHQAFKTKDGYIAIGVNNDEEWVRFCQALGKGSLAKDPRFSSNSQRVMNRVQLLSVLEGIFAGKTTQEWLTILEAKEVPCGPYLAFPQLWEHPQVQANKMVVEIENPWGRVKVGGLPWRFSKTPGIILPAPNMDQHREEVLHFVNSTPPAQVSVKSGKVLKSPLEGVLVVELAQGIAAPFCAMQLGDLGAEVIKVEPPQGDWARRVGPPFMDGESPLFVHLNRNKKGILLDMKSSQGRGTLKRLIAEANVFVSDLLPKQAESLGLDYNSLQRLNSNLVHCSVTPFGEEGPNKNKPGGEIVLQAMADVWRYLGALGQHPLRLGADAASMAGGIFAFHGTIAALICKERTGIGQKVEVSHLAAMLALETQLNGAQSDPSLKGGWHLSAPTDPQSRHPMARDLPLDFGFVSRSSDGWSVFCQTLGIPEEISKDPRFADGLGRALNEHALLPILEHYFKDKTAAELKEIVEKCGGIGVVVNNHETLFQDPQVKAMDMLVEVEHPKLGRIKMMGLPWNFEKTPGSIRLPAPLLGQHTKEVLASLK